VGRQGAKEPPFLTKKQTSPPPQTHHFSAGAGRRAFKRGEGGEGGRDKKKVKSKTFPSKERPTKKVGKNPVGVQGEGYSEKWERQKTEGSRGYRP